VYAVLFKLLCARLTWRLLQNAFNASQWSNGASLISVGLNWWHMVNHLPESAGISSRDLLAFFLFWMIEMPFLTVHPSKIKFLFAVSRPRKIQKGPS
jgi:cytosine/uracil/thiamine/allantoin permease